MNKKRRKQIVAVLDEIERQKDILDGLKDEEQEAHDNLPESIQYGERGDQMQETVDNLEYAVDNLQDAIDNISEALDNA